MTCIGLWKDSLGRDVDLDDIDKEYALNILCMAIYNRAMRGLTRREIESSALIKKLREVVLTGREPNERDRKRAKAYNVLNAEAGMPFRAPVHPRDGEPLDSEDDEGETYENCADKDDLHARYDAQDFVPSSIREYKRWVNATFGGRV